jgi:hypothetical protein
MGHSQLRQGAAAAGDGHGTWGQSGKIQKDKGGECVQRELDLTKVLTADGISAPRMGVHVTKSIRRGVGQLLCGVAVIGLTATLPESFAAETRRPVFIHANCDGKLSSVALVAFENEMVASEKYRLTPSLDDFGRMDEVQVLYMHCAESGDVAAIATNFGKARCMASNRCGSMIDGISVNATLCKSTPAECGYLLFTTFDAYVNRTDQAHKPQSPLQH